MANTLRFKRGLVSGIPTAALGEPLFTTDTFDLYIGNGTGNTRFQKYIASGTTSQLLRGDGSLLTMPIVLTSPSNGQVLKYNGTSWVNDSDAGITGSGTTNYLPKFTGASTLGNSLVFDNGSSVGIGIATPSASYRLTLNGDSSVNTGGIVIRQSGTDVMYIGNIAGANTTDFEFWNPRNGYLRFATNNTERARFTAVGNLLVGSTSDNGLRFQVTGDGYFSGSVGVGSSALTSIGLRVAKTITGGTLAYAVLQDGQVQSDVTNQAHGFYNTLSTQATSFTLSNYYHYRAFQGTIGAGSTVTNQYGFFVQSNLTGATSNYGFYGDIASGTGRWNLYMNGTAANYLAGSLGIGTNNASYLFHAVSSASTIGAFRNSGAAIGQLLVGNTVADLIIRILASGDSLISSDTSKYLAFGTNGGTERMRLDASGNIGLGVTPSAWSTGTFFLAQQIGGGGSFIAAPRDTSSQIIVGTNAYFNGTNWIRVSANASAFYQQNVGQHIWFNAPSGTAGTAATLTQAMTLDASGRLLVGGTTSSAAGEILQVTGNTLITPNSQYGTIDANSGLFIKSSTTNANGVIGLTGSGFILQGKDGATTAYPLLLQPYGSNVLIGTTTNSTFKLDVNGTMRVSGASTITGNLTVDTETLFVDAANNFVGVGTTTPAHRLHVISSGTKSTIAIGNNLSGTYSQLLMYGGLNKFNWSVGAQYNVNNAFEITPSTAIDGTTFSTPALTIASTGAATFSSSVTGASFIPTSSTIPTNGMYLSAANTLAFATASGNKLTISSTGLATFSDSARFSNQKGCIFVQTGGSLLGSISMDSSNQITIDNNGFFGLSVGSNYTMTGGNLGIGHSSFGTSATRTISVVNGTAPSTSPLDSFQMYSNDVTAGNAAPHFRTENGAVIKLYQETTGVGNAIFLQGGGNSVLDDSTFDGYTLRQIVKALRNQGILQ